MAKKHLTSSSVVALSPTFIYNKKPKSILIKCCIMAALILKGKIREMHKVNAFFKKIKIKIDYGDVESFIPCLKTKQSIDILGEGKIIKKGVHLSQSLIDTPVVGIFEGTKVSFTFVRKNNYISCFRTPSRRNQNQTAVTILKTRDFMKLLQKEKGVLHFMVHDVV